MHSTTLILLVAFSPLLIQVASGKIATGGPIPAQLSEERKRELIKYCMDTFHNQSNTAYMHKVVNVDSITSQVVNGALYNLKLEVAETDCRKGSDRKEESCNVKTNVGSVHKKCEFNVHEQPWLNHRAVTIKSCTSM